MQTRLTQQEAESLIRLAVNKDYQQMVDHLKRHRQALISQLLQCKEPVTLHILQGEVKTVDAVLELTDRAETYVSRVKVNG